MEDLSNEIIKNCIICWKKNTKKNPCVKKSDASTLLTRCEELKNNGDTKVSDILHRLHHAKNNEIFDKVLYHSECRKPIMREDRKRTFSESSSSQKPVRPGRPSAVSSETRPRRSICTPKEIKCIFSTCSFCPSSTNSELHRVFTDTMGLTLINLKKNTRDDNVRVCVSDLNDKGDAAAVEKYYHRDCLRNAQRSCEIKDEMSNNERTRNICDELLVLSVKSSLYIDKSVLNMRDINDEYLLLLENYGLDHTYCDRKKYLKDLLMEKIPEIQFVNSIRKNESQKVSLATHVSEAMEMSSSYSTPVDAVSTVANILRQEALQYNVWKFETELDNFKCPPMLLFFLNQLLFGRFAGKVTGKRDIQLQNTLDVSCQFLLQNLRTDRQTKHQSKNDLGFRCMIETPLNIGLPLSIHTNSRDKSTIDRLNKLGIGKNYQQIIDIEKRTEIAVLERMKESGNFCLPDFVKKKVNTWFAVDNIDLLEDTPYGQNTFHGTVIVLNQNDDNGEPINAPLTIPSKLPSKHIRVDIEYLNEPIIQQKPIRFQNYSFNKRKHLLNKYNNFNGTWSLASALSNQDLTIDNDGINTQINNPIFENENGPESQQSNDHLDLRSHTLENPEVVNNILQITHAIDKKKGSKKYNVMPTWASTQSLLLQNSQQIQKKVNTSAIAPLFKTSPTDYSTLYTVLCLTQNISASVVGSQRRTFITLDLDLYNRAVQIQESVCNRNWILLPGGLHVCFAIEHALGKTLEGSGIDTCAIECGTYSAAALRGIYSGKAFKRAVEYHLINFLAITMMKLDSLPKNILSSKLKNQCMKLKEALHNRESSMISIFNDVQHDYINQIQEKQKDQEYGGLAQYLEQYLDQIENLLQIISSCRQGDWEGYLAALENGVKYFFAHDLFNYARLIPLHLAQMNDIQENNPELWECLKSGDFVVNKSGIPFSSLFTDQALEQEIKNLKRYGGIVGISQNDTALDRMMHATPHLSRIVRNYLRRFSDEKEKKHEHYQLQGSFANRLNENALKLHDKIIVRCGGNPFINKVPLKNVVSSAVIPEEVKNNILGMAKLGQNRYEEFVKERLLVTSSKSIWDKITKLKLKMFSNWTTKARLNIGDKIIKLREERQLFARFLVIQQSRPEMVPKLEATIGEYELSVIPRSLFAVDGSLLVCKDKSNLVTIIEGLVESNNTEVDRFESQDIFTEHNENIQYDIA